MRSIAGRYCLSRFVGEARIGIVGSAGIAALLAHSPTCVCCGCSTRCESEGAAETHQPFVSTEGSGMPAPVANETDLLIRSDLYCSVAAASLTRNFILGRNSCLHCPEVVTVVWLTK